jgi:nucleoside-diphosphate-sugar epimerase
MENKVTVKTRYGFEKTDRSVDREINTRFCDTEKIKNILGFHPEVSLKEGIIKVIEHGIIKPKWATSDKEYTIDDSL